MKKISPNLKKLILLMSNGQFHSGEQLSQQLGITRAAIWKLLKQLQANDINIESKQSTGYKLVEPLFLLNKNNIIEQLTNNDVKKNVDIKIFDNVTSTIDSCKKASKNNNTICLAEEQTNGMGRMGRNWQSPFAKNIYLSWAWHTQRGISQLSGLSLVVSLSIVKALSAYGVEQLRIKWPNDIYWQDKKLAGILINIIGEMNGLICLIISTGINVNMQQTKNIGQAWASLMKITGHYHDRNKIVSLIIEQLYNDLQEFKLHGFPYFHQQWQAYDYLSGKKVELINGNKIEAGIVDGVDQQGLLLLKQGNKVSAFSSGDTTIKKQVLTPV